MFELMALASTAGTHFRSSSSASLWRFTNAKTLSLQLTQVLLVLMMYGSRIVSPAATWRYRVRYRHTGLFAPPQVV
jgi:hypothetical protein